MIARPRTFLLDENMPRKVLTSLQREGYSATRIYDVSLRSQPDVAIFVNTIIHDPSYPFPTLIKIYYTFAAGN